MLVDYHMHLRDSDERIAHRVDAVEPFVETAARRGVDEIGFTEHVYYFRQTRALWDRPYESERCVYDLDAYVDAVTEAKRRGYPVKVGLEVDHVGELYPDRAFLEAARLPITLASDAHVPENVGRDLDQAVDLARAAGYESVTVFEGRKARQEPLG